jgi:hypothetical protein
MVAPSRGVGGEAMASEEGTGQLVGQVRGLEDVDVRTVVDSIHPATPGTQRQQFRVLKRSS